MTTTQWLLAHADEGVRFGMNLPPIHPILVNFTAALIPTSFVADVLGRWLGRDSLRHAAFWMMAVGAAVTPLTVAAGWLWARQMEDMRGSAMTTHQWLGTGLAVVFAVVAVWRWRYHARAQVPGVPYLVVLGVLVGGLTYQGHLGGGMSFGTAEPSHAMTGDPAPKNDAPRQQQQQQHRHPGGETHDGQKPSESGLRPGWSDRIDVQ